MTDHPPLSLPIALPTTRRIIFTRLALDAHIGILEHELRSTQPLHIDADIDVAVTEAVNDHNIASVLDYRALREAIVAECTQAHVHLLETLIEQVARRLLTDFTEIRALRLRVSKPTAFSDCAAVAVEICLTRFYEDSHGTRFCHAEPIVGSTR